MRSYFSIGMLFIFLFSTVGVIAGTYRCKMNMEDMVRKSCCTPSQKSCCEKEVKLLKIKDDFLSSSHQQTIKVFSTIALFIQDHEKASETLSNPGYIVLSAHAPPCSPYDILPFVQSFLI